MNCTPSQALQEPPHLFFGSLTFHSARAIGEAEHEQNKENIRKAEAEAGQ